MTAISMNSQRSSIPFPSFFVFCFLCCGMAVWQVDAMGLRHSILKSHHHGKHVHRRGSGDGPTQKKPKLSLTFRALVYSPQRGLQNVSADRDLLSVATRDIPIKRRSPKTATDDAPGRSSTSPLFKPSTSSSGLNSLTSLSKTARSFQPSSWSLPSKPTTAATISTSKDNQSADPKSLDGVLFAPEAAGEPQDAMILNLKEGRTFMHQRFFSELVCYQNDMPPMAAHSAQLMRAQMPSRIEDDGRSESRNDTNNDEPKDLEAQQQAEAIIDGIFASVVGEALGAPLELFSVAVAAAEGTTAGDIVGGVPCSIWSVNESMRMSLEEMMLALQNQQLTGLTGSAAEDAQAALSDIDIDELLSEKPGKKDGHKATAVLQVEASFCVTPDGDLMAANASRVVRVELIRPLRNETKEEEQELRGSRHGGGGTDNRTRTEEVVSKTLWSSASGFEALEKPSKRPTATDFEGAFGVAGGHCVDLTSGTTGEQELDSQLNSKDRIRRINIEAGGTWKAGPYSIWKGVTVADVVPSLGTEIGPLSLPLGSAASAGRHRATGLLRRWQGGMQLVSESDELPEDFDARHEWPECSSISYIRNQGMCGSCYAFAATGVLADRICISASRFQGGMKNTSSRLAHGNDNLQDKNNKTELAYVQQSQASRSLALAPEHLVDCDSTSAGCGGGRLDDVWWYLRDHGVPSEECHPYKYCPVPTEPQCHFGKGGPTPDDPEAFMLQREVNSTSQVNLCHGTCRNGDMMHMYKASVAYAVGLPGDVLSLQRELMAHGSVEVGFFVFSDFHSYKRGVYSRTPGAYGPLGGHAVRLIGWGVARSRLREPLDYWLVANSWSPAWGLGGFFRIRRGTNECGIETTPAAGLPRIEEVPPAASQTSV